MSAKASEILDGEIGREPAGAIPIIFGFIELIVMKSIVSDHHDSWPDRTGIGKALFFVEALLIYLLAAVGVVTGVALILLGAVFLALGLLWEYAVEYYRRVAFKTNEEST